MKQVTFLLLICFSSVYGPAQTIGGSSIFNFLKLPNTPQLSALGSVNISNISSDIGMSFHNPSLLRESMHTQVTAVFNSMYAGIRNYHLMGGFYSARLKSGFAVGLQYLDYGSIPRTDAAGNQLGSFRPADYVVQAQFCRAYQQNWYYGASLKFIESNYGLYRSNGIAMDVGVSYYDSATLFQAAFVAKNMGTQLRRYRDTDPDDLPFDVELGISKRLANAPLQVSMTAHHLHQFDIRYNDTTFNTENALGGSDRKFTLDKVFRHFVFAIQAYAGERIEITAAYNHLRRAELNIANTTNGLNGFSMGIGVLFRKLQLRYARAYYQNNTAYNQFGICLKMNEYFGLGNFGNRLGW